MIFNESGGTSLNFKVVGGTTAPSNPKENTIWVNTDHKITEWHFGADEPNVYDIQTVVNDPHNMILPEGQTAGEIINFTIPATVSSIFEAIRFYHAATNKMYCVRQFDGSAVTAWPAGVKVSVILSNETYKIGDWVGNGTARLLAWEGYYHEEGTTWITTGSSSSVAFNALRKNSVMVCPLSVKQYISRAWVNIEAESYQNGEWVDWWTGTFYSYGAEYIDHTGDFVTIGKALNSGATETNTLNIVRNADNIKFYNKNSATNACGIAYYSKKFDLTPYSKLIFTGKIRANGTNGDMAGVGVWADVNGTYVGDRRVAAITGDFDGVAEVSIAEVTGEHYIGFWAYNNSNVNQYVQMQQLKLVLTEGA